MPSVTGQDEFFVYVQQDDGSSMRIPRGLAAGMGLSGPAAPAPTPAPITDPQLAGDLAGSLPPAPGSAPMPGWPPAPQQQSPGSAPPPIPLQGAPRNALAAPPAIAPTSTPLAAGDVPRLGPGTIAPPSMGGASPGAVARAADPTYEQRIAALPRGVGGLVGAAELGGELAIEQGEKEAQQLGLVNAERVRMAREAEQQLREDEAQRVEREKKADELVEDVRTRSDELANSGIDPNRLYKNASVPQRIVGALSLFIGGFLEAYTGKNSALAIINQQIDRDIEAQKVAIEQKRSAIETRRGLLGTMLDRYKDMGTAEAAARVSYLNIAAAKLEALAAPMPEQARLRAAQGALGFRQQADGLLEQIRAQNVAAAQAAAQSRAAATAARAKEERRRFESDREFELKVAKTGADIEDQQATREQKRTEEAQKGAPLGVFDQAGKLLSNATSKEAATQVNGQLVGYRQFRRELAQLQDLVDRAGRKYDGIGSKGFLASDEKIELDTRYNKLAWAFARMLNGPGVLTKNDVDAARDVMPAPPSFTGRDPTQAYKVIQGLADQQITEVVRGAGITGYNPAEEPILVPKPASEPGKAPIADLVVQVETGKPERRDAGLKELRSRVGELGPEDSGRIVEWRTRLRPQVEAGDKTAIAADAALIKRYAEVTGAPKPLTPGEERARQAQQNATTRRLAPALDTGAIPEGYFTGVP